MTKIKCGKCKHKNFNLILNEEKQLVSVTCKGCGDIAVMFPTLQRIKEDESNKSNAETSNITKPTPHIVDASGKAISGKERKIIS